MTTKTISPPPTRGSMSPLTNVYEMSIDEEEADQPLYPSSSIHDRDRTKWSKTSWRQLSKSPHVRFIIATAFLFSIFTFVYTVISRTEPTQFETTKTSRWQSLHHRRDDQPRITIMQHFNLHNDRIRKLQILSRDQHEKYADFWGYRYVASSDQFVPEQDTTVRQRQMNKVYALLGQVIQELGMGEEGADWILIADADVLVVEPSVPLHSLIPSDSTHSITPLIVGSEDSNGFNSGNMLYRCDINLAAYLAQTIALSDNITKEYEAAMAEAALLEMTKPEIETPPSDQRALCLVLEQDVSFSKRFFHYPQVWLNSYDVFESGGNIQLHSHLVAGRKYRDEYKEWIDKWDENWDRLKMMGLGELEERVREVRGIADEYWETARTGLPKCIWI